MNACQGDFWVSFGLFSLGLCVFFSRVWKLRGKMMNACELWLCNGFAGFYYMFYLKHIESIFVVGTTNDNVFGKFQTLATAG